MWGSQVFDTAPARLISNEPTVTVVTFLYILLQPLFQTQQQLIWNDVRTLLQRRRTAFVVPCKLWKCYAPCDTLNNSWKDGIFKILSIYLQQSYAHFVPTLPLQSDTVHLSNLVFLLFSCLFAVMALGKYCLRFASTESIQQTLKGSTWQALASVASRQTISLLSVCDNLEGWHSDLKCKIIISSAGLTFRYIYIYLHTIWGLYCLLKQNVEYQL